MHDGKNSRLEEAEEQINVLEDRVMESNEAEQNKGNSVVPSNVVTL